MPQSGADAELKQPDQEAAPAHGVSHVLDRIQTVVKETLMIFSKKTESAAESNDGEVVAPTALLKKDHRTVSALFKEFEDAEKGDAKVALAQQICTELTIHATVEERLFYPAARAALGKEGEDLIDEATVEHRSLKMLIAEIDGSSADDDLFGANVKVLQEYVEHHVKEEEREMFPKLEGKLDDETLGAKMAELQAELKARAGEAKPPRAGAKTAVHVPSVAGRNAPAAKSKTPAAKSAAAKSKTPAAKSPAAKSSSGKSPTTKARASSNGVKTSSRSAGHSAHH